MAEVMTIQKYLSMTPRKLRLVADMVRRMKPAQALRVLDVTNKASAPVLAKAIKTALANAHQKNLDENQMVFKTLEINEGIVLKRVHAGSRGYRRPYAKKTSHIRIILSDEARESNIKDQKSKIKNLPAGRQVEHPRQSRENLKTEENKQEETLLEGGRAGFSGGSTSSPRAAKQQRTKKLVLSEAEGSK